MGNFVCKLNNENIARLRPEKTRYEVTDTEMSGFKIRVSPSGVMSYAIMYRNIDGKRVRYTIGKHGSITPHQARKLAEAKLAEVRLGEDPQEVKKQARRARKVPTIKDYLDKQYLPWFQVRWKAKTTRSSLDQFSDLEGTHLDKLAQWQIEKWRKARLDQGNKPGTLNRHIGALKAALNRAVEWNLIDSNPIQGIKNLREDTSAVVRYLSDAEANRLKNALEHREERRRKERHRGNEWRRERGYDLKPSMEQRFTDHLTPLVLISINTGMRRGELFNLDWSDVNLTQAIVTIHGAGAKSGRTRHIPLNREALDALKQWKKQAKSREYVFPSKAGGRLNNVQKAWSSLLRDAEITKFRWHDMRHHFASKLVMAGVDLNTVRELLGHSDLKMTLRYAHLAPEHKAAAVARLNRGLR